MNKKKSSWSISFSMAVISSYAMISVYAQANERNFLNEISKLEISDSSSAPIAENSNSGTVYNANNVIAKSSSENGKKNSYARENNTAELMAQVTALKEQNAKLIEGKKNADARENNTAELMAQVTALKEQNAKLIEGKKNADARESNTAELAKNKGLLSFNSSKDTLSYSLGAYYSKKIIQDSSILEHNGLQISKEYITSGINDAFSNQLKIDDKEIESSLSLINDAVSKSLKQNEKLLRSKVGSKVFKKGSDGTFFVLKRKGTTKYNKGDVVRFSVYEKK